MRKLILSIGMLVIPFWLFGSITDTFAADGVVTQFEVIAPATAKVNEAIDITVRALDQDKKVVPTYRWSIIFLPQNFGDTVPMPGKSIPFTTEDNGEKKFSKWVIFKTAGKQTISVVDISGEDISGEATVTIDAGTTTSGTSSTLEEISIVSPAQGVKITSETLVVNGKTRKNSKVNITLNGQNAGSVVSDDSGSFTKSITGVTQSSNVLSVSLVDGLGTMIGKSQDITFEKVSGGPAYYNLIVNPGTQVEKSSKITLTIEAEEWLTDVNIILDGSLIKATESWAGKYIINTVAPARVGDFPITVNLTNALGQSISKSDVAKLSIIEAPTSFENVKATTEWTRAVFTFSVKNPPSDLSKFKIAIGDSPSSFSSDAVTWTIDKISTGENQYKWYIDKLAPKAYTFKIMGVRADNTIIEALTSEALSATIWGAASCTIGNVGAVTVKTLSDKSILSWASVSGALSYNIYKIAPSGDTTLFQNTKETTYTLFLSSGSVVQEDFWVKALCDTKTESADFSKASKVQTGPKWLLAIIVVISGILAAVVLRRRAL